MRQLLISTIISLIFISCGAKTYEDARKVKVGQSTNELKYIMGEPFSISVNANNEEWYFSYRGNGRNQGMRVIVKDDKIIDFISY